MDTTKEKLTKELRELRLEIQQFCTKFESSNKKIQQQKTTLEENSKQLADFELLKQDLEQYKERLGVSNTQNFDKDVIISELKLQLEKISKERDVKVNDLKAHLDKLMREHDIVLTDLRYTTHNYVLLEVIPLFYWLYCIIFGQIKKCLFSIETNSTKCQKRKLSFN